MTKPGYRAQGAELIGPGGVVWAEVSSWLEPDEVADWVRAGAEVAVDECDGWHWGAPLDADVLSRMVDTANSDRIARVRNSDEVILAPSLWGAGEARLVVLSEENAKRAKDIRDMRGSYRHPF